MPKFDDYHIRVRRLEETRPEHVVNSFLAYFDEFPEGALYSFGETQEEAISKLRLIFDDFVVSLVKIGKQPPAPFEDLAMEYSGRITLRMTPMLHRDLILHADKNRVSLNSFIVSSLNQVITVKNVADIIREDIPADRCPLNVSFRVQEIQISTNEIDLEPKKEFLDFAEYRTGTYD